MLVMGDTERLTWREDRWKEEENLQIQRPI